MKYFEIQNKIIKLEGIKQIEIWEKGQQIIIDYGESKKTVIDYENVRDNINEEKTELQKDYERIKKELIIENTENKDHIYIKELENQIEIYKMTFNNMSGDISIYKQKLRNIVNSKEFSFKKIQKLKGVI